MLVGLIQYIESLNRIKGLVRKNSLSLPECLWAETLVTSCLWPWIQTGALLFLLGFQPAKCSLSLNNHMSPTPEYMYKFLLLLFLWQSQTNTSCERNVCYLFIFLSLTRKWKNYSFGCFLLYHAVCSVSSTTYNLICLSNSHYSRSGTMSA